MKYTGSLEALRSGILKAGPASHCSSSSKSDASLLFQRDCPQTPNFCRSLGPEDSVGADWVSWLVLELCSVTVMSCDWVLGEETFWAPGKCYYSLHPYQRILLPSVNCQPTDLWGRRGPASFILPWHTRIWRGIFPARDLGISLPQCDHGPAAHVLVSRCLCDTFTTAVMEEE